MTATKPKILVILGPTASGKSDLAVRLAKKFHGEVVSADSRQVYKGLDIGTGKITKKEMQGVPHHMLSIVNAGGRYTVEKYKHQADKKITEILARNKVPIVCGGSGFYIQALIDNVVFPDVPRDEALRTKLFAYSNERLFSTLEKHDPERAKDIDPRNRIRVVRAIEIALHLGKVPALVSEPKYEALQIGIKIDEKKLRKNIKVRLEKRIKQGMIKEAAELHKKGLSWNRMEELGLEYRYLSRHLRGTNPLAKAEMIEKLETEIWHYVRRQMSWFRRDKRIQWLPKSPISPLEKKIRAFLA